MKSLENQLEQLNRVITTRCHNKNASIAASNLRDRVQAITFRSGKQLEGGTKLAKDSENMQASDEEEPQQQKEEEGNGEGKVQKKECNTHIPRAVEEKKVMNF